MKKYFLINITILFAVILLNQNIIYAYENVHEKVDISIYINDKKFSLNKGLLNIDNYTYASIDDICEIFGYSYNIDTDKLKVDLNYNNIKNLNTKIYSNVDDIKKFDLYIEDECLGNAYCYDKDIYIPLRIVANRNLCNIYWDGIDNNINIFYNTGKILGKEATCTIQYGNSLGNCYIFVIYSDVLDGSKSILMLELSNLNNTNFNNMEELLNKIDLESIVKRRVGNLSKDKYMQLKNKIDSLLQDENKGNDFSEGRALSSYQCDFSCYIIYNNDSYVTCFESMPGLNANKQYMELKNYFKEISGYEMEYITPYNI